MSDQVGSIIGKPPSVLLTGRRVLITGAARGLGLSFAEGALAAGAEVAIADILVERGRETADALSKAAGRKVAFVALDLADPASVEACAKEAVAALGGLDGLVNCGAIATGVGGKTMDQIEIEQWDRVMTVNVRGTWLMTKACTDALAKSGAGRVVNLASDTALWGAPRLMAYVASKGAVISMTRSMARELGVHGITVNAVLPGLTLVEVTTQVPEDRHQQYLNGRAIRREQMPEDVVGSVLFLLSSAAGFVTGQSLPVNGGFVLN
jgi:NAD(P)-dependent dehydrogenase (short-subunit alcohol dehydrogenase family)